MPSNPYLSHVGSHHAAHLDRNQTRQLIHQGEQEASLVWLVAAVNRVWYWTQGHPYFTLILCQTIWQRLYENKPDEIPYVYARNVEEAVAYLLAESQTHFFEPGWTDLSPTEQVIITSMAQIKARIITADQLVDMLQGSGVRLRLDELQIAPERLVERNMVSLTNDTYEFRVPLWLHWIRANHAQAPVKEEIARLSALPEQLFQRGQHFYRFKQLELAENHLRQALKLDPRHFNVNRLLARILRIRDELDESVEILERLYQQQPDVIKEELVETLLLQAEQETEAAQISTYNRILTIEPAHPTVTERQQIISEIQAQRHLAIQHEDNDEWDSAIAIYQTLSETYPEQQEWSNRLKQAQIRVNLAHRYKGALDTLQTGRSTSAQRLLANVIAEQPTYKEAARYLLQATTGIDVVELQQENQQLQATLNNLQAKVQQLEGQGITKTELEPEQPLELGEALAVHNPLNHLRVLWWLFLTPQGINTHQSEYGAKSLHPVAQWVASTLTWLPLFLPTLAIATGKWSTITDAFLLNGYRWLSGGIVLAWLFTGWFGAHKKEEDGSVNIAEAITLIIALLAAGGIAGQMGLIIGLLIALPITLIVIYAMNGSLALIMANTTALITTIIVGLLVTQGVTSKVALVIGTIMMSIWAMLTARRMDRSIKFGHASWLARLTFVMLLLAYAIIIWYGWLNGV